MPELPEVETIARGLAKRVTGEVIESIWLGEKPEPLKSPASEIAAALESTRILTVRRIGKHIVFDLIRNDKRNNNNMWSGRPRPLYAGSQSHRVRDPNYVCPKRHEPSQTNPFPPSNPNSSSTWE